MDFGVGYFPTHDGMNPGALAHMLEERTGRRVLRRAHPHPGQPDGPLA